jgi:hypothetical protein
MGAIDTLVVSDAVKNTLLADDGVLGRTRCELIEPDHADRKGIEQFITEVFWDRYGASIGYFHHALMGCRDVHGRWMAAVGFSPMQGRDAFLDVYLDAPAESMIAADLRLRGARREVARKGLVEVGNLAAVRPGGARMLILEMTRHLYLCRFDWVVITATHEIANSLTRLGYEPHALAKAEPLRLPDKGQSWGSYYDCTPQVMYVDIAASYAVMRNAV